MSESFESLRRLFSDAGYAFVEPPIVYEASVFVELAGEDLRRRLFLTSDADGTEMALRPDYTIPVCLAHLARGPAKRRADYAYLGPVFRQRRDEPDEFLQAGVESLGRTDRIAADADLLKLALDAVALLGVRKPVVTIGDSALFAALLDGLALSAPWQRRLARAFGDTDRLKRLIARAADGSAEPTADDGGLARAGRARIRSTVDALFATTGLATIGGRTSDEIAGRFLEKSALAAGIGSRAAETLTRFLAISGPPRTALAELRRLLRTSGIAVGEVLDRFEARLDALGKHGVDLDRLRFAADFGRRLDYYTGFVFELRAKARDPRPLVGGGRYDRMLALLPRPDGAPAGGGVPAVGFAIWLDRVGAKR